MRVSLNVGYIDYPFSSRQLEPGHVVESVDVPHLAVHAVLFGHHFGKYLSAQGSYMRPIEYVRYSNVNGPGNSHTVSDLSPAAQAKLLRVVQDVAVERRLHPPQQFEVLAGLPVQLQDELEAPTRGPTSVLPRAQHLCFIRRGERSS